MRYRYLALLFVLLLSPMASLLAGNVYRWVDEKGVVHYSDRAGNSGAKQLPLKTPEADTTSPSNSSSNDLSADSLSAPTDEAELNAQVRADQCEKTRQRLKSYSAADQLLITDPEGNQREMTPDEKIQAIVRAEQQTESFCQGR